jgi:hypothetical protein
MHIDNNYKLKMFKLKVYKWFLFDMHFPYTLWKDNSCQNVLNRRQIDFCV